MNGWNERRQRRKKRLLNRFAAAAAAAAEGEAVEIVQNFKLKNHHFSSSPSSPSSPSSFSEPFSLVLILYFFVAGFYRKP